MSDNFTVLVSTTHALIDDQISKLLSCHCSLKADLLAVTFRWLLACLMSEQHASVSQGLDLLRQFYMLPH